MKVIVAIKQVYDPSTVRVSRSRGILDTRSAELMMNPGDRYALEEALKLKGEQGARVVAMSMGPAEAEDILREALAMDVDEAVLLTDDVFSDVDVSAAVLILGKGIERIGDYDLILTGYKALGDGSGQFGPRLAQHLDLPQITRASHLMVAEGKVTARRSLLDGHAIMEASLPALLSIDDGANKPRFPSLPGSIAAYDEHTVTMWRIEDLGLTPEEIEASAMTNVRSTLAGPERILARLIIGEPSEAAKELLDELKRKGFLQ